MTIVTIWPNLLHSRAHKTSEMDQVLHTILVSTHTHLTWSTLIFFFFAAPGINPHFLNQKDCVFRTSVLKSSHYLLLYVIFYFKSFLIITCFNSRSDRKKIFLLWFQNVYYFKIKERKRRTSVFKAFASDIFQCSQRNDFHNFILIIYCLVSWKKFGNRL